MPAKKKTKKAAAKKTTKKAKKPAKKKTAKKPAKKAGAKKATMKRHSAAKKATAKKAKKPAKKAAKKAKKPAKKAAKKAKKASPSRPASKKLAAKKPALSSSAAPSKPVAPVAAPAKKVAPQTPRKALEVLTPLVETIAQITTYSMTVHGKTPDGRVYTGHGSILLSNDQHTRRAQYTITFDTITYRGTALLRGSLAEKNLVIVLDYHERPSHSGMVVSIHEQDHKTGKFIGRVLYQGRPEVCEETITLTT